MVVRPGPRRPLILAVTLTTVLVVSCGARRQTADHAVEPGMKADDVDAVYRALGDVATKRLAAARTDLDSYCSGAGASHHSNVTILQVTRDLHEGLWSGEITVEASCTVGEATADYRRSLRFVFRDGAWTDEEPGGCSASLAGDPPAEVRRVLKAFSDTLGKTFPKAETEEPDWE